MRTAVIVCATLAAVGAMGALLLLWAFSGSYDVAADTSDPAWVRSLLAGARNRSLAARAGEIEVPPLADPALVTAGAPLYRLHCVSCHGAPGERPAPFAAGLMPPPPGPGELTDHPPAELYLVVSHGLKHTGMPAFAPILPEHDLWSLVAFVQKLPELDPAAYRALAEPSHRIDSRP